MVDRFGIQIIPCEPPTFMRPLEPAYSYMPTVKHSRLGEGAAGESVIEKALYDLVLTTSVTRVAFLTHASLYWHIARRGTVWAAVITPQVCFI